MEILAEFFSSFTCEPRQVKKEKNEENISTYYSTNCNTVQIWSWCSQYLSAVLKRYPAIYVTIGAR